MSTRLVARLLTIALALCAIGPVAATPLQAAPACGASGSAYAMVGSRVIIEGENDPPGPLEVVMVDVPDDGGTYVAHVTLGARGVLPGTRPSWDVYDRDGGYVGSIEGGVAGSDCVSAARKHPIFGSVGAYYHFKVNYLTNRPVSQDHFALYFF